MSGPPGHERDPHGPGFTLALAASVVPVLGCAWLARVAFGFAYGMAGLALDVVLLVPVLWLATRSARGRMPVWVLGCVLSLVFVLGHAVKIAFLALPMTFDDIGPGLRLLHVLDGGRLAIAATCLAAVAGTLAWTLWPRRGRWPWLVGMCGYLALLPFVALGVRALPTADAAAGPTSALRGSGGIAYAFSSARFARMPADADAAQVAAALQGHPAQPVAAADFRKRNVHLVLMESVWDPLQLKAFRFSRDPWDPRFRQLWERSGRSRVLTPVFGGATANSEFEALCGMPADPEQVVFEGGIVHSVPCLPRVLREAGYSTVAHHPYKAAYWSRDTAYQRIGFEQYNTSASYRLEDVDGQFLSDVSMFEQTRAREARMPAGRPRLAYLVSLGSHYPYHRNRNRRPDRVTVAPAAPVLADYANALVYSTGALMDYIASVRAADPDAVVVAFGDHAPVLGQAPDPYVASGLKPRTADEEADLVALSATPLLVIDGRNGPVRMGEIPLYALPSRVLALLGDRAPNLPQASVGRDARHRLFLGRLLALGPEGWRPCHADTPACRDADRHRADSALVREDLLRGQQYTLRMAGAMHLATPVAMALDPPRCSLDVIDWGPRTTARHTPFNRQPSGRSAIWMQVGEAHGDLELVIGRDASTMTVSGGRASASFDAPAFLAEPGKHRVVYRCAAGFSQHAVAVGEFEVQ